MFDGATVSDVLAAVLRAEPDWASLPSNLHPRLRLLLERCLEKDPRNRYHDIADARVDTQSVLADPQGALPLSPELADAGIPWGLRTVVAVAVVAAVGGALVGWTLRPTAPGVVSRVALALPQGQALATSVAISADGSQVAHREAGELYLREMAGREWVPIRGTEGTALDPFFSPDGGSLGFFDDGELRRIAVSGGTPLRVADVVSPHGATWHADDTIVYASESGVWRVSADGRVEEHLVQVGSGERVYGRQLLPDAASVLFTSLSGPMGPGARAWDGAQIVVQSLETGERQVIVDGGSDARYLPTGHIAYALGTVLLAVPFDLSRMEVTGGPVPMVEAVRRPGRNPGTTGAAFYDVSETGSLVYLIASETPLVERQLVRVDRQGTVERLIDDLRDYWRPRLSPDGERVTVEVQSEEQGVLTLWVVDVGSGNMRQLTFGGGVGSGDLFPAWTPDGGDVIFASGRLGTNAIYRQAVDGTGEPELVFEGTSSQLIPNDVSVDEVVAFTQGARVGLSDVLGLRLTDGSTSDLVATPAMENMPMFSPDGRWLAYTSDATGRAEVWVRAAQEGEFGEWRVSTEGGVGPVWSRDGSELYYRGASGDLMVVPIEVNSGFTYGRARPLFSVAGRFRFSGNTAAFDVDADGRFIMVTQVDSQREQPREINVVLNWFEELRRLVPTDN